VAFLAQHDLLTGLAKRALLAEKLEKAASRLRRHEIRAGSSEHGEASMDVTALHAAGRLDETKLCQYAEQRSFDRTAVALCLLCDLPVGLVQRALVQEQPDQLLIIAKSLDVAWETMKAILRLQGGRTGPDESWMMDYLASYLRLKSSTARAALQFYRLRERADAPDGTRRS
jgi:hypothetical protein